MAVAVAGFSSPDGRRRLYLGILGYRGSPTCYIVLLGIWTWIGIGSMFVWNMKSFYAHGRSRAHAEETGNAVVKETVAEESVGSKGGAEDASPFPDGLARDFVRDSASRDSASNACLNQTTADEAEGRGVRGSENPAVSPCVGPKRGGEDASRLPGDPAPGSVRDSANRDSVSNACPNQTTAGEAAGGGVRCCENIAVPPFVGDLGSVSALERGTSWKCWIPSHKTAICVG